MKKLVLTFGLATAIFSAASTGTLAEEHNQVWSEINYEVDATINLEGVKHFKDLPTDYSDLLLTSSYAGYKFQQSNIISAFILQGNLYMRYQDYINMIKPDKVVYEPAEYPTISHFKLQIEKNGQSIELKQYDNEILINNSEVKEIPEPIVADFDEVTTYIPVRAVTEALNLDLKYHPSSMYDGPVVVIK
ncbi:stalk domain-containing protein [Halalkalibacter urbisdiaboli]|uniref:stalk domain-containing protein n=1 Tax=Halalkalibacter urbisdiaboli TaxID=1960589 RepID=UPI000B44EFA1|nr:stalk domain-containing protein [Halalkalibacter urbisdiaboli]